MKRNLITAALLVALLPMAAFAGPRGVPAYRGGYYHGGGGYYHGHDSHNFFGFSLGLNFAAPYSYYDYPTYYYPPTYYSTPAYVAPPAVIYSEPAYVAPPPVVVYPAPSYYYVAPRGYITTHYYYRR